MFSTWKQNYLKFKKAKIFSNRFFYISLNIKQLKKQHRNRIEFFLKCFCTALKFKIETNIIKG